MTNFNLKAMCDEAETKEFFYGAKLNRAIKDVYLGVCYLTPNEADRTVGPGKGHEELLYLLEGQIEIKGKDETVLLNAGEIYFIPNGSKVILRNLTGEKCYFIIAGGHVKRHWHWHRH